jgi:hypothetical protein
MLDAKKRHDLNENQTVANSVLRSTTLKLNKRWSLSGGGWIRDWLIAARFEQKSLIDKYVKRQWPMSPIGQNRSVVYPMN